MVTEIFIWAQYRKVHSNQYQILKRPFLHHLVIFKDSVNLHVIYRFTNARNDFR